MLLACTNCNTLFRIDRSPISAGRKVNCGVCKHVWIAYPENLIEEKHPKSPKQENNFSSKTDKLEKKNSLLTDIIDIDYLETLYRKKFMVGKESEFIYISN